MLLRRVAPTSDRGAHVALDGPSGVEEAEQPAGGEAVPEDRKEKGGVLATNGSGTHKAKAVTHVSSLSSCPAPWKHRKVSERQ